MALSSGDGDVCRSYICNTRSSGALSGIKHTIKRREASRRCGGGGRTGFYFCNHACIALQSERPSQTTSARITQMLDQQRSN